MLYTAPLVCSLAFIPVLRDGRSQNYLRTLPPLATAVCFVQARD
jgi:hypothetical protein